MAVFYSCMIIFSYLMGSIPTGYLMGKFIKGIDIRDFGSGNVGATNVFRVIGKWPGIATLLMDALKGYIPTYVSLRMDPSGGIFPALVGMAAISGHNWTLFLKFKGGKGVATSAGVFSALLPIPMLIALAVFLIGAALSQHVSVGSMLAALSLSVSSWMINPSKFLNIFATFCSILVIFLHKKNIERLIRDEEPKIPWKKSAS